VNLEFGIETLRIATQKLVGLSVDLYYIIFIILALKIFNLFFSIESYLIIFFIATYAGIRILIGRDLSIKDLNFNRLKANYVLFILIMLSAILLFFAVLIEPYSYDSFYYGYQIIAWVSKEPVVFGIANFSPWLATNSSIFELAALLNYNDAFAFSAKMINPIILVFFIYSAIKIIGIFKQNTTNNRLIKNYIFLVSVYLLFYGIYQPEYLLFSPNPDFANSIFVALFSIFLLIRLTIDQVSLNHLLVGSALLAFLDRSHSGFLLIYGLVYFYTTRKSKKLEYRKVYFSLLLGSIGIWAVQNFIRTGHFAYPFTFFWSQPSWAITTEALNNYLFGIREWTNSQVCVERYIKLDDSISSTFCVFVNSTAMLSVALLFLVSMMITAYIYITNSNLSERKFLKTLSINFAPIFIISILFILIFSPQIRFVIPYAIPLVLLLIAIIFTRLKVNLDSQIYLSSVILLFSLIFIFINNGSLTKLNSIKSVERVIQKPTWFEGTNYSYFVGNHCGIEFYPCSPFMIQDIQIKKYVFWTLFETTQDTH
jgi:hypothetical protein